MYGSFYLITLAADQFTTQPGLVHLKVESPVFVRVEDLADIIVSRIHEAARLPGYHIASIEKHYAYSEDDMTMMGGTDFVLNEDRLDYHMDLNPAWVVFEGQVA